MLWGTVILLLSTFLITKFYLFSEGKQWKRVPNQTSKPEIKAEFLEELLEKSKEIQRQHLKKFCEDGGTPDITQHLQDTEESKS